MIRKNYSRRVFVIEISQAGQVLGYYAGKDKDYHILISSLNDAIVFKTEKSVRHNVTHQEKYDDETHSFRVVEADEIQSTIYYDEYDNVRKLKPTYVIRVKDKSDILSEPSFVTNFDTKEETFKHSYAIEKALAFGEPRSWKLFRFLQERFSDRYDFYQEPVFIKRERNIVLTGKEQ